MTALVKGRRVRYTVYTTHYSLTVDDSSSMSERTSEGTVSSVGKRFAKVRNAETGRIESVPVWRIEEAGEGE